MRFYQTTIPSFVLCTSLLFGTDLPPFFSVRVSFVLCFSLYHFTSFVSCCFPLWPLTPLHPWFLYPFLESGVTPYFILTSEDLELEVEIEREHAAFVFSSLGFPSQYNLFRYIHLPINFMILTGKYNLPLYIYIYGSYFHYLFICWQTLSLFPFSGYCV